MGTVPHWSRLIATWGLVAVVAALITVTVLIPRLAGATPYVVLTGSMSPTMPPGTVVVTRHVPAEQIGIGSVVTYQLASGQPTVVTHRVVAEGINGKGEQIFQTQGDANNTPDAKWVRPVQIRGERWYSVPFLGYVTTFITGAERRLTMISVVSFLLLYAASMFTRAARDSYRRRIGPIVTGPAPVSTRREEDRRVAHA